MAWRTSRSFDVEGDAFWMVDEGVSSPLWLMVCEDFEVISELEQDPLLECELPDLDENCGCSGGQTVGFFCLPFLGWIRRRRNFLSRESTPTTREICGLGWMPTVLQGLRA